ncbi:hypothetical protein, partial [Botrimarina hoheduenensis]
MKTLFTLAAATLFALPTLTASAYAPCGSLAPQPAVTVIAKNHYQPVVKVLETDCHEKSVLTRR